MFEPSAFEFFVAAGVACAVGFFLGSRRPRGLLGLDPDVDENAEIPIDVELPKPDAPAPDFNEIDFAGESLEAPPLLNEPIKSISDAPFPPPKVEPADPAPRSTTEETTIEALRIEIESLQKAQRSDSEARARLNVERMEWKAEEAALRQEMEILRAQTAQEVQHHQAERERAEALQDRLMQELEGILALDEFNLAGLIAFYEERRRYFEVEVKTHQKILMEEAPIELPTGEADAEALAHAAAEQRRQDKLQGRIQDFARSLRKTDAIIKDLEGRAQQQKAPLMPDFGDPEELI